MVEINYEEAFVFPLGTLAAKDIIALVTKIDSARLNGFRIAKIRIAAAVTAKTAAEGPLAWGIGCNIGAASIEAAIEADPQSKVADNVRGDGTWIKTLGIIPLEMTAGALTGTTGGGASGHAAGMDEYVVNWSVIEGQEFNVWAYNMGTGALTTGAVIHSFMEIMGVWLRD